MPPEATGRWCTTHPTDNRRFAGRQAHTMEQMRDVVERIGAVDPHALDGLVTLGLASATLNLFLRGDASVRKACQEMLRDLKAEMAKLTLLCAFVRIPSRRQSLHKPEALRQERRRCQGSTGRTGRGRSRPAP